MRTLTASKAPWSILIAMLVLSLLWSTNAPTVVQAAAAGVPTIAGAVKADGTIVGGSGFTVSRQGPGHYLVKYPAGTWAKGHVPVVMPLGTMVSYLVVIRNADGSGHTEIRFADGADHIFTFIEAQVQ